jgi:sensor histidine kinase regulating citrate/malate metabolism
MSTHHKDRHVQVATVALDLGNKALGRVSVARKDCNRVALVMRLRLAQRLLERLRANDLEHRAEDLILVALH